MSDLLKFFAEKVKYFPMHLEMTYSKATDWCIYVYKKNAALDYPGADTNGQDVVIVQESDPNIEVCCAKAYVALIDWFLECEGGY